MNLGNLLKNQLNSKVLLRIMAIAVLVGVVDTVYLTANYYLGSEVKCLVIEGCEVVLTSQYSRILGVPLAFFGLLFYSVMFILINAADIYRYRKLSWLMLAGGTVGFGASLVFLYLQVFVLDTLCFYCLTSLASSTVLFVSAIMYMKLENSYEI